VDLTIREKKKLGRRTSQKPEREIFFTQVLNRYSLQLRINAIISPQLSSIAIDSPSKPLTIAIRRWKSSAVRLGDHR